MRGGLKTAAMLILAAGLLAGCSREASVEPSLSLGGTETAVTQAETEIFIHSDPETDLDQGKPDYYLPQERVEEGGMIRSHLTGQMISAVQGNRRPLAVMMSNDKEARPQYGINRAGVVYEAPVEGGMNRFMSLIENYDDLERIGSVRSCRTYYIYFAREFEAIYAHYGQSTFAKPDLKHVDNINGLEGVGTTAYYRSSDKKAPHNAYTSGERIHASIQKLGYSQAYDPSYEGHYLFARDGREAVLDQRPGVMEAAVVKPGYGMNQAYFVYDESDGLYHRYQYGDVHQGDEGPITAKNVVFQYCQSGYYATTDYIAFNVHTTECGFFITNGKAIPITWEKDGELGVTHYYDMDHNEVIFNQGQTWVCIISTRDFDKYEIKGKDGAQ